MNGSDVFIDRKSLSLKAIDKEMVWLNLKVQGKF